MDVIRFEGAALRDLLFRLKDLTDEAQPQVRSLEFAVDGGLKIKVDGSTWTPPLGQAL